MSYKTAGDGGRDLGWHQLNYFVNTSFVNQMVNKFSVFFVNQMVYYIFAKEPPRAGDQLVSSTKPRLNKI